MTALRLATLVLWALAITASVLGMGESEGSQRQDCTFGFALASGSVGLFTFIWSL